MTPRASPLLRRAAACLSAWTTSTVFVLAGLTIGSAPAMAQDESRQDVVLLGLVGDFVSGEPVIGAFVRISGTLVAITDHEGRFNLSLRPGHHRIEVQRIGYEPRTISLLLDDRPLLRLSFAMDPVPIALPEVVVEVGRTRMVFGPRREFYQRLREGSGSYITREDIELRSPRALSDMLRLIPGLEVSQGGVDAAVIRTTARRGSCSSPLSFVDGLQVDTAILDLVVPPAQIEGVEVYTRPLSVPEEFSRSGAACGVILVWTR